MHLKYYSTEFAAVRQNTFGFICIFKHERLCETDTEDARMIPWECISKNGSDQEKGIFNRNTNSSLKRMGRYCSPLYSFLNKYKYDIYVYTYLFLKIQYCLSISIQPMSLTSYKHSHVFVLFPATLCNSVTCWSSAWHHRVQNNTENIICRRREDCLTLGILLWTA